MHSFDKQSVCQNNYDKGIKIDFEIIKFEIILLIEFSESEEKTMNIRSAVSDFSKFKRTMQDTKTASDNLY